MNIARSWLFVVLALLTGRAIAAENQVFDELIARGVPLGGGEHVKLPEPTLPDGLPAAEQRKRIEALADKRFTWDDLTRRAVVAPFIFKMPPDDGKERLDRRVDLWFVVHASLEVVRSDDFFSSQSKAAAKEGDNLPTTRVLTDAELKKRGLPVPTRPEEPRFVATEATPLDRVSVNVTTRTIKTESADSLLAASLLEPRFAEDADFPNRWRSITRDNSGKRILGEPQPYQGLGSYVKATRLEEPAGALLIEYHLVYAEPKDWFNGANLLRSKLPILAQDAVRKVRRNLERKP